MTSVEWVAEIVYPEWSGDASAIAGSAVDLTSEFRRPFTAGGKK